jgi:magnesium transporter
MLRGFALYGDGTTSSLSSLQDVAAAWAREGARLWVDVEEPTAEVLARLGELFALDEEAREDCLEGAQRPRIDEFEEYMFLVLYGAVGTEPFHEFLPRKLAVFFCDRFLITVHREAHRSIEAQLKRCGKHVHATLRQGLDHLLHSIMETMVNNYGLVAEEYAKRLDALEERSLKDDGDASLLAELIALRRELLDLRRMASSQRDLLSPIAEGEMDYVSEDLDVHFSHVRDRLTTTLEIIDTHREILHGIRENYHLTLSNRLNEIMKVLTIFSSFFLPLTFIAGIYGMNMPLWPAPEGRGTFWAVLLIMGACGAAMLVYFRRKKWF